jgi:2-keto-3-deoxy-L-rhamnonate aldolase RhmA
MYGDELVLTLFTNNPSIAAIADQAGVDRVGLDLECLGKATRQGHLNTWVSNHREGDLRSIKEALSHAKLFVRTNPPHPGLPDEVERYISIGTEVLMLPMFTHPDEAKTFVSSIAGRARVSLLVETAQAALRIEDIVKIPGVDEIHIGLNDLHLSLGLSNHFELLTSRFMEHLAAVVHESGLPFGFGGIAHAEADHLPIPSRLVYPQYPRLNAKMALVSRSFFNGVEDGADLLRAIPQARERMTELAGQTSDKWEAARIELRQRAAQLAKART